MKHSRINLNAANPSLAEVELGIADVLGKLMHFWGFKRPMGRVWALLYLSPEPIPAATLAERLKMSAGATSMTLGELSRWGAVRKVWRPGERKDFYEAETRVYRLVLRVLSERELPLVRDALEVLKRSRSILPRGSGVEAPLKFKRSRMDRLCRIAEVGERLLDGMVAGKLVDARVLQDAAGASQQGVETQ